MVDQDRAKTGKFLSKSKQPRHVRSIRLTDAAWEKLGELADKKNITRADLLENALEAQPEQLELFGSLKTVDSKPKELINKDTRKSGTKLALRLGVSSASLTNWMKDNKLETRTAEYDPEGISWSREKGTKNYYPNID